MTLRLGPEGYLNAGGTIDSTPGFDDTTALGRLRAWILICLLKDSNDTFFPFPLLLILTTNHVCRVSDTNTAPHLSHKYDMGRVA